LYVSAKRFIKHQDSLYDLGLYMSIQKNVVPSRLDEASHYSFGHDDNDYTCSECGSTFEKPLLARVSSCGNVQTYYACPRCITKVATVKTQKSEEKQEDSGLMRELKKREAEPETQVVCAHFFGYLKKRPKDAPVPDGCLTCARMVECLVR
jgi:hypothetical protein